jgi:pimeloyl-ACP methyl ester carboxylesterase
MVRLALAQETGFFPSDIEMNRSGTVYTVDTLMLLRKFQPYILDRWRRTFPHAGVTTFADAGHWPHEESPAEFVQALGTIMDRAAAP